MVWLNIILGVFLVCFPFNKRPDLEVISATEQEFTGGREETAGGVHYSLELVLHRKGKILELESLWVEGYAVPFGEKFTHLHLEKNDTLSVLLTHLQPTAGQLGGNALVTDHEVPLPVAEGGVWLEYRLRRKIKYVEIGKLKKLDHRLYE